MGTAWPGLTRPPGWFVMPALSFTCTIRRGQRTPAAVVSLLERMPELSTLHAHPELLIAVTMQVWQEFNLP